MNKRQKVEAYFKSKPKAVITAAQVYRVLFIDCPDTTMRTVSGIVHGIVKTGGCVEIFENVKNKNYYRYKEVIVAVVEAPVFDDSNHQENRLKMMSDKWS